jgi:NAD-dependent deacetylase sirtuin 5
VWFGEELDSQMLKRIHQYIERDPVDLCIVIGTSGTVYPAAGYGHSPPPRRFADVGRYASVVKAQGGKVAIVDIDCSVRGDADWLFEGDAAKVHSRPVNLLRG